MPAIHETKMHGKQSFPYTIYRGKLPEWLSGFPLHWHDEMEIIYVTEGQMTVTVQNDEYHPTAGDIIFIQPQFIHSIRQYEDQRADYYNFLFRDSLLSNNHRDICYEKYLSPLSSHRQSIPKFFSHANDPSPIIAAFLEQLIDIGQKKIDGNELLVKSALFGIMHYVSRCSQPENAKEQYIRSLYNKLKESVTLIQNHYNENITVEQAARLCNFSPSHFAKMFRQLTGTTFTQYLKNYRLEVAAERLSAGTSSISDTAFACGFNNLSYFTRSFSEKYGMTPYRFKTTSAN